MQPKLSTTEIPQIIKIGGKKGKKGTKVTETARRQVIK